MVSLARLKKETLLRGRFTAAGRAVLKAAAVAAEPFDYYTRRRVASQYNRQFPSDRMSGKNGFTLLPSGSLPGTAEVLETCREIFASKKAALDAATPTPREQKKKKSFLRDLLDNNDLRANPILVDFALSDPLFSIVTNYLGVIPTLNRVDLVYSVARQDPNELISSQLFHQDPEGLRQAKVFLNVFDVGEAEGPFTLIPASDSERAVQGIRRARRQTGARDDTRYRDDEVAAHIDLATTVRLLGPAGEAAVVDTSRCLHAGSRVRPGHFRLVLFIQYCTSHEKAHTFDARRFRGDPVRWLALERYASPDS